MNFTALVFNNINALFFAGFILFLILFITTNISLKNSRRSEMHTRNELYKLRDELSRIKASQEKTADSSAAEANVSEPNTQNAQQARNVPPQYMNAPNAQQARNVPPQYTNAPNAQQAPNIPPQYVNAPNAQQARNVPPQYMNAPNAQQARNAPPQYMNAPNTQQARNVPPQYMNIPNAQQAQNVPPQYMNAPNAQQTPNIPPQYMNAPNAQQAPNVPPQYMNAPNAQQTRNVPPQYMNMPNAQQAQNVPPQYMNAPNAQQTPNIPPQYMNAQYPQQMQNNYYRQGQYPVQYYPPKKKKASTSAVSVMLTLGVLFIITAGLILATALWETSENGIRAIFLFGFSGVFFAVSAIAKKGLKLNKTACTFYTLGTVFLPITFLAVGWLELFGEWFSVHGDGKFVLLSVIFLTAAIPFAVGYLIFRYKIFAWFAMIMSGFFISSFILSFTQSAEAFFIISSCYTIVLLFTLELLKKREFVSDTGKTVYKQASYFLLINTAVISLLSLFLLPDTPLSFVSCVLFSLIYLNGRMNETFGFEGAAAFLLLTATGLYKLITPDNFSECFTLAVILCAAMTLLSAVNIFGEKIRSAFTILVIVLSSVSALANVIRAAFAPVSALSLCMTGVLCLIAGYYAVSRKNHTSMVFLALSLSLTALNASVFITGNPLLCTLLCSSFILAAFLIVSALRFFKIKTTAADIVFVCVGFVCALAIIPAVIAFSFIPSYTQNENVYIIITLTVSAVIPILMVIRNEISELTDFLRFLPPLFYCAIFIPVCSMLNWSNTYTQTVCTRCFVQMLIWFAPIFLACVTMTLMKVGGKARKWLSVLNVYATLLTFIFLLFSEAVERHGWIFPSLLFILFCIKFVCEKEKRLFSLTVSYLLGIFSVWTCIMHFFGNMMRGEHIMMLISAIFVLSYIVYEIFARIKPDCEYNKRLYSMISILLCACASLYLFVYCNDGGMYPPVLITAAFAVISRYRTKSVLPLIPLFPLLYASVAVFVQRQVKIDGLPSPELWAGGILAVLMLVVGRFLHRKAFDGKYPDLISLSGLSCLFLAIIAENERFAWFVLPYIGAFVLNLYGRTGGEKASKIILSLAFVPFVIACWVQPFFSVPVALAAEWFIAPIFLYAAALRAIHRKNKNAVFVIELVTFIAACVTMLFLLADGIRGGMVIDAIILGISALGIFIASFVFKRKKWFVLSFVVLVILLVYMSRAFWLSLDWWLYLLITGIVLIAVGSGNELVKQKKIDSPKEKIELFLSDWKW